MNGTPAEIDLGLKEAQAGSRSAFARLVEGHQSMVYSLLLHILNEEPVAEEIAQDVFLELHRNLSAIESPSHLVRWLRTVASRRAIDEVRRRKFRSPQPLDELPEPSMEYEQADVLLSQRLGRLLERLPARHRAIVVLRYQEDLDPTDIASHLEIPVATVKSTLHRALGMLRRALERSGACKPAALRGTPTWINREAV
jgi:RNA polymerase sigma-70 factor, ECF subfamily